MKELLFLNLKISIAIAIFYLVYLLFLSKDTFFVRNRFYLLFALLLAVFIPMLKIPVYVNQAISGNLPLTNGSPIIIIHDNAASSTIDVMAIIIKGLFFLYLAGVVFMLLKLCWGIRSIVRMVRNAKRERYSNMQIVSTKHTVSPFSIYKWLIISEEHRQHQDISNIVEHELIHCRQLHSIDLFVAEVIRAFQWFNPFAWMAKKAIAQNHEFIVDQRLLADGMEPKVYQYSLVHTAVQGQKFSFVNHFNTNLLKKRITMMNKCESPKWYGIKNVMILVSLAAVVSLTASFETKIIAQDNKLKQSVKSDKKVTESTTIYSTETKSGSDKMQIVEVFKDTIIKTNPTQKTDFKTKQLVFIIKDSLDAPSGTEARITEVRHDIDTAKSSEGEVIEKIIIRKKGKDNEPLVFLNGKKITNEELNNMDPSLIASIEVWKNDAAIKQYGEEGKNGVVKVTSKSIMINNGVKTGLTISQTDKNVEGMIVDENKIRTDSPYIIKVIDNKGNTTFETKTTEKTFKIPLSKLKEGDYFISVVNVENHYSCSSNYTFKHK